VEKRVELTIAEELHFAKKFEKQPYAITRLKWLEIAKKSSL